MKGQPNPRRAELAKLSGTFRPLVKAGKFPNVTIRSLPGYEDAPWDYCVEDKAA